MKNNSFKLQSTFVILTLLTLLSSCALDNKAQLKENIDQQEQILFEENKGIIDKKMAANMILAYTQYVDNFPEDEQSPDYLFKAADVSINIFHSQQTINLFNRLLNDYPNNDKIAEVLFLKAFTFDNYMQEYDSAKIYYQAFLSKYPKHNFAKDAKMSMENLGKSPEDIVKGFQ